MKFYSFQIVIEKETEGEGYFAYTPNVPGCFSNGRTIEEASCHSILDGNYDEDRSRISTGYGPENITHLRRFALGVIKSRGREKRSFRPQLAGSYNFYGE
jgi:predicted transposase YbfD/YdcC